MAGTRVYDERKSESENILKDTGIWSNPFICYVCVESLITIQNTLLSISTSFYVSSNRRKQEGKDWRPSKVYWGTTRNSWNWKGRIKAISKMGQRTQVCGLLNID